MKYMYNLKKLRSSHPFKDRFLIYRRCPQPILNPAANESFGMNPRYFGGGLPNCQNRTEEVGELYAELVL